MTTVSSIFSVSRGATDRTELICIQGSSTNEPPIDIRHAEELDRIGRLHAAAIEKSHTLCDFGILLCQLRTDCCVHFLGFLRRSSQSGANGPDRLVSNNSVDQCADAKLGDDTVQLTPYHFKRLPRLALFQRFTYAKHRCQTFRLNRRKLLVQNIILLANQLTTLGVPDKYQFATCISQLARCNFTRQRALLSLNGCILRTNDDRRCLEPFDYLTSKQTGRHYGDIDAAWQRLLAQTLDQLSDAGAGTVHFPVTSYHWATHATPRGSKWAQMLPNSSDTGKPKSGANFSNQFCEFFGVRPDLRFVLAFDHDAHQRLGTRFAQQYPATPGHLLGDASAGLLDRRMRDRVNTRPGEAYVDQDLRTFAQFQTRFGQAHTTATQGQYHLQRGNNRITGGGVLETDDMTRVFTAYLPVAL
ncbi:hypothetical protein ALP78_05395 [Pseudomonas coronafaciens pv. striafaciens]|uniref:Uncharacterized protein n=1 Tax=Pseudomonas coronafaciens pv. striafaciens TaxID=235276 RepID=A0A3M4XYN5_9PSED|nr:hypothetical protein ALP78_05395 [Pseudomonas coronafaciens pv. striafaciens]